MLKWALAFFIIALVAAILGFGGLVVGTALSIAKFLFFMFVVLLVISLIVGFVRRPPV